MGRQEYLTRLALGRSPYQEPFQEPMSDAEILEILQSSSTTRVPVMTNSHGQQFDYKGRPVDLAAEARKSETRRAHNTILCLSGVLEDRKRATSRLVKEARTLRQQHHDLAEAEDDAGQIMDGLMIGCHSILTWLPNCFVLRYQAGLIDPRDPFLAALRHQIVPRTGQGWLSLHSRMLPGAAASLLYTMTRSGLEFGFELFIEWLSHATWQRSRNKQTQLQTIVTLQRLQLAAQWTSDLLLLPLLYFIAAQQLGVAPLCSLLLPFQSFSLRNMCSVYTLIWAPTSDLPYVSLLSSPAALLLSYNALTHAINPPLQLDHQYPTRSSHVVAGDIAASVHKYHAVSGLLPYLRHCIFSFRTSCMAWLNYRPITTRGNSAEPEQNLIQVASKDGMKPTTTHRAGSLASLVPEVLATNLDTFLIRLLLLPLEGVMLSAITASYVKSDFSKAAAGLLAISAPESMTRADVTLNIPSWDSRIGTTAVCMLHYSKIGLAIALQSVMELSLLGGAYAFVRRQGTHLYGWRASAGEVSEP